MMIGELVGDYRLRKRIGKGSFGKIYSAECLKNREHVAVKLEDLDCKSPQLCYESRLMSVLSGGTGIPKVHWVGRTELHNVMVVDMLGKSIEKLFQECDQKFSLKTVLMLADQMLSCVEFVHSKNFIHRDIKPENFVMGLGKNANQVFLIDYGLAKAYRDQNTHAHIPYGEGRSLSGTAGFASVAALRGVEQSRRDDLESLGFLWLYLLRGPLPWMGVTSGDRQQRYTGICNIKARTSLIDLCVGVPTEFIRYFKTVRALKFADEPNYAELRLILRNLFDCQNFVYDYKYDWCVDGPDYTADGDAVHGVVEEDERGVPVSKVNSHRVKMSKDAGDGRRKITRVRSWGRVSGGRSPGETMQTSRRTPPRVPDVPRTRRDSAVSMILPGSGKET